MSKLGKYILFRYAIPPIGSCRETKPLSSSVSCLRQPPPDNRNWLPRLAAAS